MMLDETSITHSDPAPIIYVKGSHREIGRQLGEAMRAAVQHSIENARQIVESTFDKLQLTWENAQVQSSKYIPFSKERYPQYVEELEGMAEGANVNYSELAVVNGLEAVTMDALHLTKCTSMAVNQENTAHKNVLVAHNEDWLPDDESDVYVVHATPDDEPRFLAMTYGGLLPNVGFNEAGIAQCCDTVYPDDIRIGVPRVIVSRAVLGAHTIGQAIRSTLIPLRAAGYNHLLAHESGELFNVEVSSRSFDILYSTQGILAHTNNYLSPKMEAIEKDRDDLVNTRVRYFRALHLLSSTKEHTIETLQMIQRDHINFPDSICNHSIYEIDLFDREKTITSQIMDLTERKMELAWGNPCKNQYYTYKL